MDGLLGYISAPKTTVGKKHPANESPCRGNDLLQLCVFLEMKQLVQVST
jgi:hypothetical protein